MMATPNSLRRPEEIALSLQLPQGYRIVKQHIDGGNPWGLWCGGSMVGRVSVAYSCRSDDWKVRIVTNTEYATSCDPEDFYTTLAGLRVRGLI